MMASSRPIPDDAPVTMAYFSFMTNISLVSLFRGRSGECGS
jgi:hypothetical protein